MASATLLALLAILSLLLFDIKTAEHQEEVIATMMSEVTPLWPLMVKALCCPGEQTGMQAQRRLESSLAVAMLRSDR